MDVQRRTLVRQLSKHFAPVFHRQQWRDQVPEYKPAAAFEMLRAWLKNEDWKRPRARVTGDAKSDD